MKTAGTHQAGFEANPPEGTSRDSERHGSAGETALASLQPLEEHQRKVTALRQALIEGENSGEANELDIRKIKTEARQRSGS